jgi:hypothetical protein
MIVMDLERRSLDPIEVLSRHLRTATDENRENPQSGWSASQPKFESEHLPNTSPKRYRYTNLLITIFIPLTVLTVCHMIIKVTKATNYRPLTRSVNISYVVGHERANILSFQSIVAIL